MCRPTSEISSDQSQDFAPVDHPITALPGKIAISVVCPVSRQNVHSHFLTPLFFDLSQVWPYLLGHYKFGTTASERHDTDDSQRCEYEQTMSEWLAIEVIVRQRDKETMAANLLKLSSGGSQDGGGHIPLVRKDSNLSNDVFMSVESDDYVPPETLPEESSNATSSPDGDTANSVIDVTTRSVDDDGVEDGGKLASDEGLGDSIARPFGSVTDSRRSDSCNTDRNLDSVKSESDDSAAGGDTANQRNIIVTGSTVDIEDPSSEDSGQKEAEAELSNKQLLMTEDGGQFKGSCQNIVSSTPVYIMLRRSRGYFLTSFVLLSNWFVLVAQLRCADKRIVNIMKVYI